MENTLNPLHSGGLRRPPARWATPSAPEIVSSGLHAGSGGPALDDGLIRTIEIRPAASNATARVQTRPAQPVDLPDPAAPGPQG